MGCRQCTLEDLDMINDDILCKISGQGLTPAFIFDADELKERVKAIKDISGVDTVSLVAHDGEFRG